MGGVRFRREGADDGAHDGGEAGRTYATVALGASPARASSVVPHARGYRRLRRESADGRPPRTRPSAFLLRVRAAGL